MDYVIDLFLHLDVHLAEFVAQYGIWVYAGLFAVIFAETGLVVTPFLPGDSLLFAAGALAATGAMDITLVLSLITVAAILGNTVNYAIGRAIGPRVFTATDDGGLMQKLLNRKHLDKAHAFFEQHGGLAVVSSRFAPIIRTFVPFVAGVASMNVTTFVIYNIAGGLLWTAVCVGAGYAFGNVPIIKENFSIVALGIVGLSMIPIVLEIIKHRRSA
jgi:membrane-associated protein